jgi:hypothetical protein
MTPKVKRDKKKKKKRGRENMMLMTDYPKETIQVNMS